MIWHYLLVGFRNLVKYREQTLFSVFGLTVGFVCFAISALWLRYEMSYDSFHSKSSRIYKLISDSSPSFPDKVLEYIKADFPEVENATCVGNVVRDMVAEGEDARYNYFGVDSNFFEIFDIKVMSGDLNTFFDGQNNVILTGDFAPKRWRDRTLPVKLFGGGGYEKEYNVKAVVKSWGKHTNLPFDFIVPADIYPSAYGRNIGAIYLLLREGTDVDSFKEKIRDRDLVNRTYKKDDLTICALEEFHYNPYYGDNGKMKFKQIMLFSIAGIFVIQCLLLNYLSLYISRIQSKRREIALRVVNGASDNSLFMLLLTEFVIVLLLAVFLGFMLIEWLMPHFVQFADIEASVFAIYGELSVYVFALLCISLILSLYPIYFFKRETLQVSLQQGGVRSRNLFRRGALVFQLIAGIIFLFCTSIFVKQVNFLHQIDLGFDHVRIKTAESWNFSYNLKDIFSEVKALPEVEDVTGSSWGMPLPFRAKCMSAQSVEENVETGETLDLVCSEVASNYFDFFKMKCLQGELFDEMDMEKNRNKIVVSQIVAEKLGYAQPIGKIVKDVGNGKSYYIVGVVNNTYTYLGDNTPLLKVYIAADEYRELFFRCLPGKGQDAEKKVTEILSSRLGKLFGIRDMDIEYKEFTRQECTFLNLLYLLSFICMLSSFFGIYSMVSLACEQRRKEIAVRKVNGAGIGVLLGLFLKEYYFLLAVASAIAFPIGYILIKAWVEQYVWQTSISWWVFAGVFLSVAVVMTLIIVARVWRTVHVNPALELKKE